MWTIILSKMDTNIIIFLPLHVSRFNQFSVSWDSRCIILIFGSQLTRSYILRLFWYCLQSEFIYTLWLVLWPVCPFIWWSLTRFNLTFRSLSTFFPFPTLAAYCRYLGHRSLSVLKLGSFSDMEHYIYIATYLLGVKCSQALHKPKSNAVFSLFW